MRHLRIAAALLLIASACTQTSVTTPPASADVPMRGGEVVELVNEDFTTLQPAGNNSTRDLRAQSLIYERLIDMDPRTAQPRPRLGTWQQSADGRTIDWRIAPNAVWSDGQPIVAADLLTFFRAIRATSKLTRAQKLGPKTALVDGLTEFLDGRTSEISGISVDPKDPKRFSVRFTSAACTAIWSLQPPLLPAHVFATYLDPSAGDAIDRAPANDAPPVSSGPFVFSEWRRGERLRLVRNERYFLGAPLMDAYVFKVAPFETWPDHLMRAGADYIKVPGQLGVGTQRDAVEGRGLHPGLRAVSTAPGDYTFIGWNTQSASAPALRDKRIRQALAYGLDGALALSEIFGGVGTRMDSHHAPDHWAHPAGLEPYSYDPARARGLIESAGYRMGPDGIYRLGDRDLAFTLKTNMGNKQREALAQFALDQYRKIGVRTTVQIVPFSDLVRELTDRDTIEAFVLGWALDEPDDPYSIWHSTNVSGPDRRGNGNNFVRFVRPEVDAALERGRNGPDCSIAARQREYATFNKILNEEQPYYFGFALASVRAVNAKLRGFEPATFSHSCCLDLYDVHKWWFAK